MTTPAPPALRGEIPLPDENPATESEINVRDLMRAMPIETAKKLEGRVDKNHDGHISASELGQLFHELEEDEAKIKVLRWELIVAVAFLGISIVANLGTAMYAVEEGKETKSTGGALQDKSTGEPVATVDSSMSGPMITLPVADHGTVNSLSFVTADNVQYHVAITKSIVFNMVHAVHMSDDGVVIEAKNGVITAHNLPADPLDLINRTSSVLCSYMDCFSENWKDIPEEVDAMDALKLTGVNPEGHPRTKACGWAHGACTQAYTPSAAALNGAMVEHAGDAETGRRRRAASRARSSKCKAKAKVKTPGSSCTDPSDTQIPTGFLSNMPCQCAVEMAKEYPWLGDICKKKWIQANDYCAATCGRCKPTKKPKKVDCETLDIQMND